jgi:hypothetical protein
MQRMTDAHLLLGERALRPLLELGVNRLLLLLDDLRLCSCMREEGVPAGGEGRHAPSRWRTPRRL